MSKTSIEWTDTTWSPTRGCSRVSEGCVNCYAERMAARFSGPGRPFHGFAKDGKWTGKVELIPSKLDDPLRWRKPRRVFVNSMSDLFHEALPFDAISEVYARMACSPQHTFQVLTKRPRRRLEYSRGGMLEAFMGGDHETIWPLPNVWEGVSVEDQATADERIPLLLETPAAVRFVSYEPALGPVDFSRWMWPVHSHWPARYKSPEEASAAGADVERKRQALVSAHRTFIDRPSTDERL